jgi:hypothetical protein
MTQPELKEGLRLASLGEKYVPIAIAISVHRYDERYICF